MSISRLICLAAVALLGFSTVARAANIAFGTVTPVGTADATLAPPRAGDTLIGAVSFDGAASSTVVTLSNSTTITFNDDKASGAIAAITQGSEGVAPGGNAFTPTTGNANFDKVLSNFGYDGAPTIATISGLTSGKTYDVLLFASDDRSCCGGRTVQFGDGNGNKSSSFALSANDYVVGTFTANASTQTVQSIGVAQGQSNFNDLVVFQQAPEPASLGILAVGCVGLLARRRRAA